jgi:outer membrane protein assembly factor BamB
VSEGKVYAVVHDPERSLASLYALDVASGSEMWTYQPKGAGSGMSVPTAMGGMVVVGTSDRLVHALSAADGKTERWRSLVLSAFSPVSSSALSSDALLVSDYPGGLYRLDPGTGARLWDYQLNELVPRSSPVVSGTAVLLGLNDGRLVAIDLDSGLLVWQGEKSPGLIGAIAVSPELVIAVKGGMPGGLVAWEHDPTGKLLAVPSPTVVDPATLLGNAAIAVVATFIVLFVPFRLLASRVRPAFDDTEEDDAGPEEEEEE